MSRLRPGSSVVILDMLPSPSLEAMYSHHDEEGNCIHRRSFEDGSQFEVVKNFPTEAELREWLGKHADNLVYREHEGLRRWVVTMKAR